MRSSHCHFYSGSNCATPHSESVSWASGRFHGLHNARTPTAPLKPDSPLPGGSWSGLCCVGRGSSELALRSDHSRHYLQPRHHWRALGQDGGLLAPRFLSDQALNSFFSTLPLDGVPAVTGQHMPGQELTVSCTKLLSVGHTCCI